MQLQQNYQAFLDKGAEIVALAVAPASSVDGVRQAIGAAYPMLADSEHKVAEAYGVYNLLGDGLAAPSVFIIDPNGHIVWSYIGSSPTDRPSVAAILEHLR
ncbi:MAG: peroxiredoxin family protein [Anaerolineae bacterium]|nr:peroxiredoxin family protein [Anaerolineae bacterium]